MDVRPAGVRRVLGRLPVSWWRGCCALCLAHQECTAWAFHEEWPCAQPLPPPPELLLPSPNFSHCHDGFRVPSLWHSANSINCVLIDSFEYVVPAAGRRLGLVLSRQWVQQDGTGGDAQRSVSSNNSRVPTMAATLGTKVAQEPSNCDVQIPFEGQVPPETHMVCEGIPSQRGRPQWPMGPGPTAALVEADIATRLLTVNRAGAARAGAKSNARGEDEDDTIISYVVPEMGPWDREGE